MIPCGIFNNKGVIVANLAIHYRAGTPFRKLIADLTLTELRILTKNEDLGQRIKDISYMEADDLREHMIKHWGLEVESCQTEDWWVDIEPVRKKLPAWSRATIEGRYIHGEDFVEWGRKWLLEEVRVNLSIRYIQDLREKEKLKKEKEQQEIEDAFCQGWGWGMGC